MSGPVQHYGRNSHGRDYVVGDIHGCFDQLRVALERVSFGSETDRLFSVGDLIDRGTRSAEALQWLSRPWFHACAGNHEDMALRSRHDEEVLFTWTLMNGGDWWLALDAESRAQYLSAFRQLPAAMEIETVRGRVGIVHADLPADLSWPQFVAALESGDEAARHTAMWGRQRAEGWVTTPVEGIDQVVCGHTIMPDHRVHRQANVWFIDTGAFVPESGGRLTLLALDRLFEDSATDNSLW
ncbi:MAG: metallophosphoesterase [Gammaproteobacteria bacterium]|jgi:serine/threonine protein phosphatase 1